MLPSCDILKYFIFLSLYLTTQALANDDSTKFSEYYEKIYQIQVVSENAGSKSSIGSGFQVTADGHIITNYHVISEYIHNHEHLRIRYVSESGEQGPLELLDFDIINDLAVLKHPNPSDQFFSLTNNAPIKGSLTYALGNPGDWGFVMVSGYNNGLVEHSFKDNILFSGSLNSGMSGGPALNTEGEVIGVNVATAGSQLSFLVPVSKARRLLTRDRHLDVSKFNNEIAHQIKEWQIRRTESLIENEWDTEPFLSRQTIGELRHDFQCWGDSNEGDEERKVEWISRWCEAGDEIFISSDVDAGQISYYFLRTQPITLNSTQFARRQSLYLSASNSSDYRNSTNYHCATNFLDSVESETDSYSRIVTCLRAFKHYPDLYDSVMIVLVQGHHEAFKAKLSLSGMERSQIQVLNQRFAESAL